MDDDQENNMTQENVEENTENVNGGGEEGYPSKFRTRKEAFKRKQKRVKDNLKGFGKKGIFGRGTQLDPEQGTYFFKIFDVIREDFESAEDKAILANNTLETCSGNEVNFSSNQIASRVIENLLPFADENKFENFMTEFGKNYRPICSDKFASHIFQKLIEIATLRSVSELQNDNEPSGGNEDGEQETPNYKKPRLDLLNEVDYNLNTKFTEEHINKCNEFVIKSSNFLLNNLEDFVYDSFANYLIRSNISNLIGVCMKKLKAFNNRNEIERKPLTVPNEWNELVIEYGNRLLLWPQLPTFPYDECTSGILQSLLQALQVCDKSKLKSFGKKLIDLSFIDLKESEGNSHDDENLPKVFSCESSIRLLETMLKVAGKKLLNKIWTILFENRLVELSQMRSANFAVQKLFENVKSVEEFEKMFDELSPTLEKLLQIGYTGVVLSIAQCCLRLKSKQAAFMKALQLALHCDQPKEKTELFPLLVLKLKPYEIYIEDKSNFVHLHGSLILQAMLQFNKPINIVMNILNTKNETLSNIFCTPSGSHIADTFMSSSTIGDKSREKIIRHMQGTYFDMVMNRNGSRAFEAFFNAAGDKQKEYLMSELSKKSGLLAGTPSGKFISSKYRVHTFSLSLDRWKCEFNSKNKAKKLFKDIIE